MFDSISSLNSSETSHVCNVSDISDLTRKFSLLFSKTFPSKFIHFEFLTFNLWDPRRLADVSKFQSDFLKFSKFNFTSFSAIFIHSKPRKYSHNVEIVEFSRRDLFAEVLMLLVKNLTAEAKQKLTIKTNVLVRA